MDDNLYRNQPGPDPQHPDGRRWDTHEMAALPSSATPVAERPVGRTRTRFTVAAGVAAAALLGGGMWMGAAYADGPSTPTGSSAPSVTVPSGDGSGATDGATTAPSDGGSGTSPTTGCGCAAPAPPAGGPAATPPKAGEAPTPPKAGEAPTPPKAGDAPTAPKAGEAPAAPAPPAGGADCSPAPAPSASSTPSGS
ncbi:hypothetical protein [Phycicoccus sonneratiae]|uniref:Uncharacterized protein n=1 Tax=Phycicoccus sonneratiae TaxID=2807628 RepID=A0ABS2CLM1_9MICO|nr:hypothetical protein [Phycicoccus sonneraticus]MBM6400782.1 hypothetical protein [Phycicoccus sonneraticus]